MVVQLVQPISWWATAATIANTVGVLAAITFGIANLRQRSADEKRRVAEEEAKSLAQARLVITGQGHVGVREADPAMPDDELPYLMEFPFANHGDRPVLDVHPEIWREIEPGNPESAQRFMVRQPVVASGESTTLTMRLQEDPSQGFMGWLIRWTDADGKQWYRDDPDQDAPRRYIWQRPGEARHLPG
ncbi:hypothetical protein [Amycolatopsis thermophila]|uniref:Uncharacterized protein n=1 Tax=Amycolatopsis thermophila TaxID=206084 RepID=A0ABU0EMW2_9PSEU|nr:hypothetical protein [Amycolatopsis thermophila]MDQ0376618.1 hypothetical protein [Amycolatopsis thermophila]